MPYRHTVKKKHKLSKVRKQNTLKNDQNTNYKGGMYKASISFITYIYVFAKKNKMLNFLFFSE